MENSIDNLSFFWLHIKKAAGTTLRSELSSLGLYTIVDRVGKPQNFLDACQTNYNDILNNYRVPLGKYQFKRSLYAKQYLYPNYWDTMYRCTVVREPYQRCLSMYKHFGKPNNVCDKFKEISKIIHTPIKIANPRIFIFEKFLNKIEEARQSQSNYFPQNLSFQTHTASVYDDITDDYGQILIPHIYRSENIENVIKQICLENDIEYKYRRACHLNVRSSLDPSLLTKNTKKLIRKLYYRDFDLYEDAKC